MRSIFSKRKANACCAEGTPWRDQLEGNMAASLELDQVNSTATVFDNPWNAQKPSVGLKNLWRMLVRKEGISKDWKPPEACTLNQILPVIDYTQPAHFAPLKIVPNTGLRFLWMGHASCYVQLDGVSFLTDPVFSQRCAPAFFIGPKRFRPVPFTIQQMKANGVPLDAVVISHNHYDHVDLPTVTAINRYYGDKVTWLVPLRHQTWFQKRGCAKVKELAWWYLATLPSSLPTKDGGKPAEVQFVCTPAQHWSIRSGFDRNKTLWSGWAVVGPKHRFYFAGDTGYNARLFKQIGAAFKRPVGSSFDLAALPIGAYLPRYIMEPYHISPQQAVVVHQEVCSQQSIGIHWGTFQLGREGYLQPKKDLLHYAVANHIDPENEFFTIKHGEIVTL